jgi:ATP-binding cassette subfamily B protein
MKLLLKFYTPTNGSILIGNQELNKVSNKIWRSHCGVVMQEGYIFNDTIAGNIAIGEEHINQNKLIHAIKMANIEEHINDLPLGLNTKIGQEGMGLSTGQKQRLFIARSIYKNPEILFFDEATSALDASNEKIIMENLNTFFLNKTAIVIAHRLSTVKNADQIVVLEQGKIIEIGTHNELVALKGSYFKLVQNQLELGN